MQQLLTNSCDSLEVLIHLKPQNLWPSIYSTHTHTVLCTYTPLTHCAEHQQLTHTVLRSFFCKIQASIPSRIILLAPPMTGLLRARPDRPGTDFLLFARPVAAEKLCICSSKQGGGGLILHRLCGPGCQVTSPDISAAGKMMNFLSVALLKPPLP